MFASSRTRVARDELAAGVAAGRVAGGRGDEVVVTGCSLPLMPSPHCFGAMHGALAGTASPARPDREEEQPSPPTVAPSSQVSLPVTLCRRRRRSRDAVAGRGRTDVVRSSLQPRGAATGVVSRRRTSCEVEAHPAVADPEGDLRAQLLPGSGTGIARLHAAVLRGAAVEVVELPSSHPGAGDDRVAARVGGDLHAVVPLPPTFGWYSPPRPRTRRSCSRRRIGVRVVRPRRRPCRCRRPRSSCTVADRGAGQPPRACSRYRSSRRPGPRCRRRTPRRSRSAGSCRLGLEHLAQLARRGAGVAELDLAVRAAAVARRGVLCRRTPPAFTAPSPGRSGSFRAELSGRRAGIARLGIAALGAAVAVVLVAVVAGPLPWICPSPQLTATV